MKRAAVIGLSVGFGILAVVVVVAVCLIAIHHFRTYRADTIAVGDTYTIDGRAHTLDPLPQSKSALTRYPVVKDSVAKALKSMHRDLKTVLDKNGIECWAAGGTLLGWVRHRGFIPWDDDIDLHLRRADLLAVRSRAVRRALRRKGLDLYWTPHYRRNILKIMRVDRRGTPVHYPFVDLIFEDYAEERWGSCADSALASDTARCSRITAREVFDPDDIFPLREALFEGEPMWIPRRPEALLRAQYGDSVWDRYRVDSVHWGTFFLTYERVPEL